MKGLSLEPSLGRAVPIPDGTMIAAYSALDRKHKIVDVSVGAHSPAVRHGIVGYACYIGEFETCATEAAGHFRRS